MTVLCCLLSKENRICPTKQMNIGVDLIFFQKPSILFELFWFWNVLTTETTGNPMSTWYTQKIVRILMILLTVFEMSLRKNTLLSNLNSTCVNCNKIGISNKQFSYLILGTGRNVLGQAHFERCLDFIKWHIRLCKS